MSKDIDEIGTETAPRHKKSVTLWLVAGLMGLCLVFAVVKAINPSKGDPADDAKRVCQEEFIPKRLKAPATAKFSDVSVSGDGAVYTVSGAVDSENSFGALVRAQFRCVVKSSGDQWLLQSANVDG